MMPLCRYVAAILFSTLSFTLHAQLISSDFASNMDGWTAPDATTFNHVATGGNPGGMITGTPFFVNVGAGTIYLYYYFNAPAKFLGNRNAYYNGTLRYDVQQSSTNTSTVHSEVQMYNNLGIGIYYFPPTPHQPPATGTWQTFSVNLSATTGYWKTTDNPAGTPATEATIRSVLSDLATLSIRGLYRDANVTTRLDNVTLMPPIIIDTQPSDRSICSGNTTTFTTAASNNPSITYRWQRETSPSIWTDLSNTGAYSNVTTATLTVNTAGGVGAGNYRCRVSGTAADDVFTTSASLTLISLPSAPTTTGTSSCAGGAFTLTASGGTNGQYRWYTVSSGGTAIAGQTNSSFTTPVLSTTTTYYVAINNGTCESSRTSVTATVNTPPTAPTANGGSSCGNGTVTLTASGASAGQYRWYTASSGGTAIAGQTNSSFTTPEISTTTTYYVAINNGTCESSRTSVTATINTVPGAPTTTGASSCGSGALTLTASGASAGQYRWYTVSSGGTAIAGQTNSSFTTPVLSTTTTYYVAINNGTCESSRTSVTATIGTLAAPTTTGGSTCGEGSVTLTASGGSSGQYRWYTVSSGGTAISGATSDMYITPVISTTTTYYVSINNGTCEGPRTAVTATINTPPAPPTATSTSTCAPGSVTLTASGGSNGQYRWYIDEVGGTAIAGQTSSTYVTPSLLSSTIYHVAINNGTCESARTPVTANVIPLPPAPSATATSSCTPAAATITASGALNGQYRWYTIATGGTPIPGQTNNVYVTSVLSTTTTFYVAVNVTGCESSRTPVVVSIADASCNNHAPEVETTPSSTVVGGVIELDLEDFITDADDNLDPSTLKVITPPGSGASVTIVGLKVFINYSGLSFVGPEEITISVCDLVGACTEQTFDIEVVGDVTVFNAISPGNDGKNDVFVIENIDKFENTRSNRVTIYNRWGDLVWEGNNYNNTSVVFKGKSKNDADLPSGTYFYKIEFKSKKKALTGALSLKR